MRLAQPALSKFVNGLADQGTAVFPAAGQRDQQIQAIDLVIIKPDPGLPGFYGHNSAHFSSHIVTQGNTLVKRKKEAPKNF